MNFLACDTRFYIESKKITESTIGLLVDLRDRHTLTSNRESDYGRHDVMPEPQDKDRDPAIFLEFKVNESDIETDLKGTVAASQKQIRDKG